MARWKKGNEEVESDYKRWSSHKGGDTFGRRRLPVKDYIVWAIDDPKAESGIKRTTNAKGQSLFFFTFQILEPAQWAGFKIWHFQSYDERSLWFYQEWLDAIYPKEEQPFTVDFEDDEQFHQLFFYKPFILSTRESVGHDGETRLRGNRPFLIEDPILLEKAWNRARRLFEKGKSGDGPRHEGL